MSFEIRSSQMGRATPCKHGRRHQTLAIGQLFRRLEHPSSEGRSGIVAEDHYPTTPLLLQAWTARRTPNSGLMARRWQRAAAALRRPSGGLSAAKALDPQDAGQGSRVRNGKTGRHFDQDHARADARPTPLSPVDAQQCNSLDGAGLSDGSFATRSATAAATAL